MDLQKIVDAFSGTTCALSVEALPDGKCGEIRIVAGNKAYAEACRDIYVPDAPYDQQFPIDRNFEELCYRAAILKQPMHTYVHPASSLNRYNVFMMPLESDEENIGYCICSHKANAIAEPDLMSYLSLEVSSDVLRTCIKLRGANDFQKTMDEIIGDIRRLCDAKRCCVMLADPDTRRCSVLCEASSDPEKFAPIRDKLSPRFYSIVETWPDTIADNGYLIVRGKNDMQKLKELNPLWHESLTAAEVDNLILFPLSYNGETLGYIWVTHFNVKNTSRIKQTLELTTFFIASEIYSRQLLDRLRVMSRTDLLTGLLNRNAMNMRIDGFMGGTTPYPKAMGIVAADLNGLKLINDTEGHGAGDSMLCKAADLLREEFGGCEIYRAGGDEFVILCSDVTEDEFQNRVARLRQSSQSPDVSFAVGCRFEKSPGNIRAAMHLADEDMYRHKELYYSSGHKR